jgi:putative endonuclease
MRRVGSDAEDRAADYLIELGFTVITRRYKTKTGELDLVLLDGDELVFVEVKQRKSGYIPEEAISRQKINRLYGAANAYCRANQVEGKPYRFDVVAVGPDGIRHHQSVFTDLVDLDPHSASGFDEESGD